MLRSRLCTGFIFSLLLGVFLMPGCVDMMPDGGTDGDGMDDGPVAEGISGKLGDPLPNATDDQLASFERGKSVFNRVFDLEDGLGPAFNVTFCGACHERPTVGGSAGLYRNFVIAGRLTDDGAFLFSESAGDADGVLRKFAYSDDLPARPDIPSNATIFAQRNPIPFFGVGLLAELSDEEILRRVDPDDADGDGISGRANFDRGFVGRFGRKSQTVSIEGFIRGPLFNHLGITSDPLTEVQRALLPVDSSLDGLDGTGKLRPRLQAAAPDGPLTDDDAAPDPELSTDELFDLVSFSMLLAAPTLEEPTEQTNRGRLLFHDAGCVACHTPRLNGPRGPLPVYSDLLLHDMGDDLADGIPQGEATGREFRTQPLWGISAVGPYLHDGRAETLSDAILAHGGEGQASRDAFAALSDSEQEDVIEFMLSLGGRDQFSVGLVPPNTPIADVGTFGGPTRALDSDESAQFLRGRTLYDTEFGHATGAGGLEGMDGGIRFNGDSCRACHFQPVLGGAGPRDVNVIRHGMVTEDGTFVNPLETPNSILHSQSRVESPIPMPEGDTTFLGHRQTPHTLGLGLIGAIPDETIMANADPDDLDGDGISGRAHVLSDGRLGKYGWKADVPSIAEFVRDAMAAEIGLTVEAQDGLTFGITVDNDGVADPELLASEAEDLAFFLEMLGGPPRQAAIDEAAAADGEALFESVGCASCHIPVLTGSAGDAALYSDLLLHEILPEGQVSATSDQATEREFRTAPLWGLSQTAPYMHSGLADTIEEAILLHDGEAVGVRDAFEALSDEDKANLLAFLDTL